MNKKPSSIVIPRSPLGEQLYRAAEIKREMAELLMQLEYQVTNQPIAKVGLWRHDTMTWVKRNSL
jgi:hypothetical protein